MLDFDGSERAGLHLGNSDLNALHILLQQLQRKDLAPLLRKPATDAFFTVLARGQAHWQGDLDQLDEELVALRGAIEKQRALCASQPKVFTTEDQELGRGKNARRICVQVTQWSELAKSYSAYVATMRTLLGLRPENFAPSKLKIEELIPRDSMGQRNTIYD